MPLPVALRCGLRWRCPNCQRGRFFGGWFRVLPHCPECGLSYFRESGYYVGAMMINYGVTVVVLLLAYLLSWTLPDVTSISWQTKIALWLGFAVAVSLALMRHSYSFWLALDFWLEPWEPERSAYSSPMGIDLPRR